METNHKSQATVTEHDTGEILPLIYGFTVTAGAHWAEFTWQQIGSVIEPGNSNWTWIHLNRLSPETRLWLEQRSGLDEVVVSALLQDETRPRIDKHESGFLLNLRGVNLNPGADPNDMISLRIWVTQELLISTRARRVLATEDLRDSIRNNQAPSSPGEAIVFLADRLTARIGPVVSDLDDEVDALEDVLIQNSTTTHKSRISQFRRSALTLRRYIAPQREALDGFVRDGGLLLSEKDRLRLRDIHDRVVRIAEDLDLIRERAMLLQEQLIEERAETMNKRLFIMAIISAIFLPLSFITGLFGVNIGGMPGINSPWAFLVLCVVMMSCVTGLIVLFKKMRWLE